jgi:hypothetical protein
VCRVAFGGQQLQRVRHHVERGDHAAALVGRKGTVYIVSFSDTKDGPEQWRRYGSNGLGVCLGVRIDSERQINSGLATGLIKVSYDQTEWLQTVRQTVEPILLRASQSDVASIQRNINLTLGVLSSLAAYSAVRAKNPMRWAAENESRFIAVPHDGSRVTVHHSPSGKPFVSLVVRNGGGRIALPELIVGPNNDPVIGLKQAHAVSRDAGYVVGEAEYPDVLASSIAHGS